MAALSEAARLVWGAPALCVFAAAGLWLTHCSRAVQLRRPGQCIFGTLRRFARPAEGGGVSPLQALSTALGGTVGTGNIAGVALAMAAGGPGVLFWMWVSALLGMAIKYSEALLAVKFRERDENGRRIGGPMYYIVNGLGERFRPLAALFSAAGALATFGMGAAVQSGEMGSALDSLCSALELRTGEGFPLAVGLIAAASAALVLLGGARRLGRVAALLVPGMSAAYAAACLAVIAANAGNIIPSLEAVVRGAFRPEAGLAACMGWGFRRGVFSNEAGLGSAPIAHAASAERDCVRQGMAGVFEVFADTIVICTLTGLALLTSGVGFNSGSGSALCARAMSCVFGPRTGAAIIAAGMLLFAFSSLLSWGMYGSRCCAWLLGRRAERPYCAAFCAAVLAGAIARLDAVWLAGDILNALMAAPNLLALTLLGGVVKTETQRYFEGQSREKRRA